MNYAFTGVSSSIQFIYPIVSPKFASDWDWKFVTKSCWNIAKNGINITEND